MLNSGLPKASKNVEKRYYVVSKYIFSGVQNLSTCKSPAGRWWVKDGSDRDFFCNGDMSPCKTDTSHVKDMIIQL